MLDACSLAGMNVLRLLSEGSAAAIAYGPYRIDEFAKEETVV